jgi:hypothetical protein
MFGKKMIFGVMVLIMVLAVVPFFKSGAEVTGVTFYQDADYGGKAVTLGAGNYNLSQLNAARIPTIRFTGECWESIRLREHGRIWI